VKDNSDILVLYNIKKTFKYLEQ